MAQLESSKIQPTSSKTNKWLRIAVLIGFAIAAFLTAIFTFISVRDFVTSWEITNLPGVSITDPSLTTGENATGLAGETGSLPESVEGPPPPTWDGANRVTALIMGLDYRDWQSGEGAPRTDTMILLTLDPINRTAGILNIPRDLWVNIPGGFDYGRINTAYSLGESYKLPGGGPQLASDTVQELLGVPIDFYAQVDFRTFERFINEIGGVKVEIPERIKIDPLGDNNTKWLEPGKQNLPGNLALAYVRARKTEGGDFDRAERQQQVILAIRNQLLRKNMLPLLISKAPQLYNELSSGIRTNMNLDQVIRLAWLASQIPAENIRRGSIGAEEINFAVSPDGGQEVLKPLSEKIRLVRDEIFTEGGAISPYASTMDPTSLMKSENARVGILNGSYTPGLAARTTDYLKSLGINVSQTDNAQSQTTYSEITFYTAKPYTVKYLVDLIGIDPLRIRHIYDPASPVDISVTIGDDWANSGKLP